MPNAISHYQFPIEIFPAIFSALNGMVLSGLQLHKFIEARWCIYMSLNWVITGASVWRQAITQTNDDSLSIGPSGTKCSEIFIENDEIALETVICQSNGYLFLGLNVLLLK